MQGRAGAGRRRASGPALSIYVEKCAFFPSTRRNTKVEYIMLPLDFLHLAICVTYFTCRRKHLSFWNGISIYSRTFSECQNQRSLKKFPPDRNISTWKESATHRRAQIASNRHSINRNKYVEGQFYIKRFVRAEKRCQLSISRPSKQAFLRADGCMPWLPSYKFACRPSRQDFFSPDGRTRRTPAAFNAISRRRLILHRNLKTNF